MNYRLYLKSVLLVCLVSLFGCQAAPSKTTVASAQTEADLLVQHLRALAKKERNPLLKRHFESLALITADTAHGYPMGEKEMEGAKEALAFMQAEGKTWETYLRGPRPLIMAFRSPTDGKNSFYWLFLPQDFDPKKKDFPFYMELHGSGGGSNNPPWKMLYQYLKPTETGGTTQMYRRDGFMIYPWGRGDKGYNGIAFADIKECLADFDATFPTDPDRQYVYGFSMGGKGAYQMALEYPDRWTALGIYSGIMRSTPEEAATLKHLPIWMTWGETERWVEHNRTLRDHLQQVGANLLWEEQPGVGHSYKAEYQAALMQWFLTQSKPETQVNRKN